MAHTITPSTTTYTDAVLEAIDAIRAQYWAPEPPYMPTTYCFASNSTAAQHTSTCHVCWSAMRYHTEAAWVARMR